MNKLIKLTLLAILTASVSAFAAGTLSVGYQEKEIEFGKVTNAKGSAVTAVDYSIGSFNVGASANTHLNGIDSVELYKVKFLGGYTFFSTLADVKVGTEYSMKNSPGKDSNGHFRPFVSVGKGPLSVTGRYDVESDLSNLEAKFSQAVKFGKNYGLTGAVFAGYTDANDVFPRTVKQIKYTNAYYGGSLDASWKMVSVGAIALQDGNLGKATVGLRSFVTLKF
jgi:hypothetical protein